MTIELRTIIDRIEIMRDGTAQVRMRKEIIDTDYPDDPLTSAYHRTIVPPGHDVEAQIAAVDDHLLQMRCGPCDKSEWDRLRSIVAFVQTPDVVAAFKQRKAAAEMLLVETAADHTATAPKKPRI